MADSTPIVTSIRKVIFENFNEDDLRFNNDQIFEILKKDQMIESSLTIDDMEVHFKELCDAELLRTLHKISPHNGSSYSNHLRKFSVIHVKKTVILHHLRVRSAKIPIVVLLFSFVSFR